LGEIPRELRLAYPALGSRPADNTRRGEGESYRTPSRVPYTVHRIRAGREIGGRKAAGRKTSGRHERGEGRGILTDSFQPVSRRVGRSGRRIPVLLCTSNTASYNNVKYC